MGVVAVQRNNYLQYRYDWCLATRCRRYCHPRGLRLLLALMPQPMRMVLVAVAVVLTMRTPFPTQV